METLTILYLVIGAIWAAYSFIKYPNGTWSTRITLMLMNVIMWPLTMLVSVNHQSWLNPERKPSKWSWLDRE